MWSAIFGGPRRPKSRTVRDRYWTLNAAVCRLTDRRFGRSTDIAFVPSDRGCTGQRGLGDHKIGAVDSWFARSAGGFLRGWLVDV